MSFVMMWIFNRVSADRVIARLPFEPWSMLSGFTHRGLEDEDMRNVSIFFIYSTAHMAFRGIFEKLLGNRQGPRMPVDYQTPKWL